MLILGMRGISSAYVVGCWSGRAESRGRGGGGGRGREGEGGRVGGWRKRLAETQSVESLPRHCQGMRPSMGALQERAVAPGWLGGRTAVWVRAG